jgi:hypothetical protein
MTARALHDVVDLGLDLGVGDARAGRVVGRRALVGVMCPTLVPCANCGRTVNMLQADVVQVPVPPLSWAASVKNCCTMPS